jgi:hypothetical protein
LVFPFWNYDFWLFFWHLQILLSQNSYSRYMYLILLTKQTTLQLFSSVPLSSSLTFLNYPCTNNRWDPRPSPFLRHNLSIKALWSYRRKHLHVYISYWFLWN